MAIALALEFPGGTQEQYDRVMDKLGMKGTENWPQGIVLHVAGPTEKGWEVVDVWESRQDFDRFLTERLGRAVQEAGLAAPTLKEFTVYNSMGLRSPVGAGTRSATR